MQLYSKNIVEQFEGCVLNAYQDIKGIWTIGYGHTQGVYKGQVITFQEAQALLDDDLKWAERIVNQYVHININQNEFDALVDFVFNVGSGNFINSTLLKLLNQGQIQEAAEEFEKWDHAAGVVVSGLLRRRLAEKDLFLKE